jgi:trigger factor
MESTRQMMRNQFGFSSDMGDEMKETIDKIARNYLFDEKNNGQNYSATFNRVFDDKVIEYIKSQLTLADQTVSLDEFRERANAQG